MGQFQDQCLDILSRAHQDGTLSNKHNMVSSFMPQWHSAMLNQLSFSVLFYFSERFDWNM